MNMFKPTTAKTPSQYIEMLDEPRKTEIKKLDQLIQDVTKQKPGIMSGMLGYGKYHYKSKSGREGEWYLIGLASQKHYISLYVCAVDGTKYVAEKYKEELKPASVGRSCIRFKKVEDMDVKLLEKVIKEVVQLGGMGEVVK